MFNHFPTAPLGHLGLDVPSNFDLFAAGHVAAFEGYQYFWPRCALDADTQRYPFAFTFECFF